MFIKTFMLFLLTIFDCHTHIYLQSILKPFSQILFSIESKRLKLISADHDLLVILSLVKNQRE